MYQNVRFGADPELFLKNSGGFFISAIGKIGGSKQIPRPIDDRGSAVQEDNVAVEFNIAPAKSAREFVKNLYIPLTYIRGHVKGMGLIPAIVPSAIFPESELDCDAAQEFGCEPDYNVWTGKTNPRPKAKGPLAALRTCGGHIHVSWDDPKMNERKELIKAMDLFQGVPSVLMDPDSRRRVLYGRAGAYRPKLYGVEYRVLSNFWITSPQMMKWAYRQANRAIEFIHDGGKIEPKIKDLILTSINANDKKAATYLVRKFNLTVI